MVMERGSGVFAIGANKKMWRCHDARHQLDGALKDVRCMVKAKKWKHKYGVSSKSEA